MKKKVSDLAPNVELKSSEITVKKDPKRKRLLIFLAIGLVAAIALFGFLFMDRIIAIFDKYAVIENKGTEEEIISDADAKNTLHFYKTPYDDTTFYVYNNEELTEAQSDGTLNYHPGVEEIGKYNCKNSDCEGAYINDSNIFVRDGDSYLYNYITKAKESLGLDASYDWASGVTYNDKLYGLFFNTNGDGATYYSLGNKKSYNFTEVFNRYDNSDTYYIANEEGYFAFNIINNSFTELPFSKADYEDVNPVSYKGKLYGYILHKSEDNSYDFYSIKDKKITITGLAESGSPGVETLQNNIIIDNKLYDFSTGEILHDFSTNFETDETAEDYYGTSTSALGNIKGIYYSINTDAIDGYYGFLLNKDFNVLFNGKTYDTSDVGVTSNGNLIIRNEDENSESTTFSMYDKTGVLVSKSKTYKEVLGVYENYIAVVDTDNYLKLVDSDGSVVAKFVKWTSKMYFHSMLSGYYEYKSITGIYLVVQDNYVSSDYEDEGYGYEYYYDTENKTSGKIATYIGGYAKPVLYLYPTKKTNVTITFANPKMLTTTYPKYNNSWKVTAYPNGDLYDKNNNYYYALYWEELKNHEVDFKEGFYVTKENAISFLEEKLTIIGLNAKERNEFIMYWLPILEKNNKNLVYFELTEERDAYSKIIINPKPDSLLRVAIHVKKVAKKVNIKEQELSTFERTGFTAIEWGGVEH